MLSFFTIPKAFTGRAAVQQRNAIQSWLRLSPDCEVFLLGDDPGVAEAARELGARHLPNVSRNEFGTPLLNSAFSIVADHASRPFLCYVNADILITPDFLEAIRRIPFRRFLAIGRRQDLDLDLPWDFAPADWATRLKKHTEEKGTLHPPAGSDFFVFPRGDKLGILPPFAVGRPWWDNWMIQNAFRLRAPIVDITDFALVVHQNHDYSHIPVRTSDSSSDGPEGDRHSRMTGPTRYIFTLLDATHYITNEGRVHSTFTPKKPHFRRRFLRWRICHPIPFVMIGLMEILASRVKRCFIPYPKGYTPPPFLQQVRNLLHLAESSPFPIHPDKDSK